MWWQLPTELIEHILDHVSFPDYVALTQANRELRRVLDTESLFLAVLESNYRQFIEAYDWPIDPDISKTTLWAAFGHLRVFFNSLDLLYPTLDPPDSSLSEPLAPSGVSAPSADPLPASCFLEFHRLFTNGPALMDIGYRRKVLLDVGLNIFATHSIYSFPLVYYFEESQAQFQQMCAGSEFPIAIPLSRLSWSRRLLQLQNFGQAVKFFHGSHTSDTSDIEKCYFELSRCYNDFGSLAHHRSAKLTRMRAALRAKLPISRGELQFASSKAYNLFLQDLIATLLPYMTSRNSHGGQGGNILRIYEGSGQESQLLHLSILAKLLRETVFDKLSFKISGGPAERKRVCSSMVFLIVGASYILVDFGQCVLSIYSEEDLGRLPVASITQAKTPMVCSDVIQRAFEWNESEADLVSNFDNINWNNCQLGTSQEKLRFIRTILIPISENRKLDYSHFSPLIHENDFFAYFFCAQAQVGQDTCETHQYFKHIMSILTIRRSPTCGLSLKFTIGDLVANTSSNYFGAILGFYDVLSEHGVYIETLPFDRIERSVALEKSLKLLNTADLGTKLKPFLNWIVSTEGFNYAGMFLFSSLSIGASRIRFSSNT